MGTGWGSNTKGCCSILFLVERDSLEEFLLEKEAGTE
jgi:hypothetical protein